MITKNSINRLCYSGLVLIQSTMLMYVFYKKKNRKTLLLTLLSIIGMAFHFEYPVYILKGYKYKTKMLSNKEKGNALGSMFSQVLFVPTAALFITAFRLGWKAKI